MFELSKTFRFDAGHILKQHEGMCGRPHGHHYTLTVTVRGKTLIEKGPRKNMILDFNDISAIVKPFIKSHLDHHWLNDTLETDSPSAEFIAWWIYQKVKPLLPSLYSITLHETPTSFVTYKEEW